MLHVGLTGGIGSGKSTVAARLTALGAVLIDGDVLAREVVAPGTEGLAEIVATFGEQVLRPDGTLDRAALAAVVFADSAARERLNAIVHPRIRARSAQVVATAAPDAVVVQDMPLLVEGGMAPGFALVVIVDAAVELRVARLREYRGMAEDDARARIAAQASDEQRRAVADVWLDNNGTARDVAAAVDRLWAERILPFEENLRLRRAVCAPDGIAPDPGWASAAARIAARVARAAGERGRGVAHVGPTAVPGLPARDVLDLQLGVDSLADATAVRDALQDAGFPSFPCEGPMRLHGSADPARPVHLTVRPVGSPAWRQALLLRDWLRSSPGERSAVRQMAEATYGGRGAADLRSDAAQAQAEEWAATSGWAPSLGD